MNSNKIVGTGPIDKIGTEILSPFGDIVIAPDNTEESLLPLMKDAVGLVVRGDGIASANVIESAPKLKVIGRTGAGFSNVDIQAATARKIPVVYTPGANARAVAEGTMAFIMALCKQIYYWDQRLKEGDWTSRNRSKPSDMQGSTLGIIGFGRIGQNLAKLAASFDMTILAYDPYATQEKADELKTQMTGLEELLKKSDFISIHAPLTEQTKGLINSQNLALVKPGAYLINMARGELVESLDILYDAMVNGQIAGVGLDVFAPEPPDVSHSIFGLANCITSPHVHGMTPKAMAKILETMAMDMAAVLRGDNPKFVVNPEVLI